MQYLLGVFFGSVVGCALGLTGAGGSILALPILVYALSVPPHEAVGVSLAAVGATAAGGLIQRLRRGEVDLRTGLIFAVTGMLSAPLGVWLNAFIPESWLLGLFAAVMLAVAIRMWMKSSPAEKDQAAQSPEMLDSSIPRRRPPLASSQTAILLLLGLALGVFSGLFGVGGGFVIVPALVLFGGMKIHRAVATSLLVITLVSLSGIASYLSANRPIDFVIAGVFALGGVLGMSWGVMLGRRISGPSLQRGFSLMIVAVAVFITIRNVF